MEKIVTQDRNSDSIGYSLSIWNAQIADEAIGLAYGQRMASAQLSARPRLKFDPTYRDCCCLHPAAKHVVNCQNLS